MGHIINSQYCEIGDKAIEIGKPLLQRIAFDGEVREPKGSNLEVKLQRVGADILLWDTPDHMLSIEVKGAEDNPDKPYKSMFVETIADSRMGEIGWFPQISPDYLFWIYTNSKISRLIRWEPFKSWYLENCRNYKTAHQTAYDTSKDTIGTLIPWKDIAWGIGYQNFGSIYLDQPETWDTKLQNMGLLN
jgi:hypothetical protein